MKRWPWSVFLWCTLATTTLAIAVLSSCGHCTYVGRIFDSQCRSANGNLSFTRIVLPPPPPPPPPPPQQTYLSAVISCVPGQATLCNHYSSGALVTGLIFPDTAGNGYYDWSGGRLNTCNDAWTIFAQGSFQVGDVGAVYLSYLEGAAAGGTVTCTDVAGCTLSAGINFTNYNPANPNLSDGNSVSFGAGKYLACATIISYNVSAPLPPLGSSFFLTNDFTLPPAIYTVGSDPNDPTNRTTNLAVPASDTHANFVRVDLIVSSPNTPLNFNTWGDYP